MSGRGESGFTAVEMTIATALMALVSLVGFGAVGSVFTSSNLALDRSQDTTASALALSELRQEIVSGNVAFNPEDDSGPSVCGSVYATNENCAGNGVSAGFSLRIYTQNNGNLTCVQWRVVSAVVNGVTTNALETRAWEGTPSKVEWTTLVTGVSNPTSTPPFSVGTGTYEGLVDVDLYLDPQASATAIQFQESIAGRDAWIYSSINTSSYCSPVPTS